MRLLIVIVAFNSERVLPSTLAAVLPQMGSKDTLCIFDNASKGSIDSFCGPLSSDGKIEIVTSPANNGFTGGNNSALQRAGWQLHESVLLLNPDLVLPDRWIEQALEVLHSNPNVGILSGPLVKFDFDNRRPTNRLDSLGIDRRGIFRSWTDVDQGCTTTRLDSLPLQWSPPAICGALMLLPRRAIEVVMDHGKLFDDRFFAYKEDIDLSLRVRKAGFDLLLDRRLLAYHGRGWSKRRKEIPYALRRLSAKNDLYLHYKHRSPYFLLSAIKAIYVWLVEGLVHLL